MRTTPIVAVAAALVLAACETGDLASTVVDGSNSAPEPAIEPLPTPGAEQDPALSAALAPLTDWSVPTTTSSDDRALEDASWQLDRIRTTCVVQQPRTVSRTFDELTAFPFQGPVLPGVVIEGRGILEGDIRVIPLDRAPLRLVSTLDSERNVVTVDEPTTASLQEAVTALKRDADAQLTGIDVTPADITYVRQEVSSVEESLLGMAVSLRYAGPALRARFDSQFQQEDRTEKHSIVVRLVQPMFTLRADSSQVRSPAELFGAATTADEVADLVDAGRVSSSSPPLLIDTVTYGRTMTFTMTSSSVASASELEVAIDAAYGGFSGSADLTDQHRQVLSESRIELIALGGDQDVALGAIRDGDLSRFFDSVNTTAAAPLSMTLRTLDGDPVAIADEATVRGLDCTDTEVPHAFAVEVSNLNGFATIKLNGNQVGQGANEGGARVTELPASRLRAGANTVTVEFGDWFPCGDSSITVNVLVDGSRVPTARQEHGALHWCPTHIMTWDLDSTTGRVTVRR